VQLLPPPHPDVVAAAAAMTAETVVGSGWSNSNSDIAGRRRARLEMVIAGVWLRMRIPSSLAGLLAFRVGVPLTP
jgi:hypothetical protein